MVILIRNQQRKIKLKAHLIERIIRNILRHEGVRQAELSFVFVSRQKIQALNRKYLKRPYATDVLAFDLGEKKSPRSPLIGEIVISTDAVMTNSRLFQTNPPQELILYVIHGLLHLLGFDDHRKKDVIKMRRKEGELLKWIANKIKRMGKV